MSKLIKIFIFIILILLFRSWLYNNPRKLLEEKYQDKFIVTKITSFNIFEHDKTKWNKEDIGSFFDIYYNFIAKQKFSEHEKFKGTIYVEEKKVSDYYVEIMIEKNINEILNRNINKFDDDSIIFGEAQYDYCLSPEEAIIVNFTADKKHKFNINIYYNKEEVIPNKIFTELDEELFEGLETLDGELNFYIVNKKVKLNMEKHHEYRHNLCNDCHALLMACPHVSCEYVNGKIKITRIEFLTKLVSSFAEKKELLSDVPIVIK